MKWLDVKVVGGLVVAGGSLLWSGTAGAAVTDITAPGDPIIGVSGVTSTSGGNVITTNNSGSEGPTNLVDNSLSNKFYTSTVISGTSLDGFVVTPASGSSIVTAISFATGNDAAGRDPLTFTIQGSTANAATAQAAGYSGFTTIFSGGTGLATNPGRNTQGPDVAFANSIAYTSYRVLFGSTRPSTDPNDHPDTGFQLSEVQIGVPEPTSLGLIGTAALGLLGRRRRLI